MISGSPLEYEKCTYIPFFRSLRVEPRLPQAWSENFTVASFATLQMRLRSFASSISTWEAFQSMLRMVPRSCWRFWARPGTGIRAAAGEKQKVTATSTARGHHGSISLQDGF